MTLQFYLAQLLCVLILEMLFALYIHLPRYTSLLICTCVFAVIILIYY